MKVALILLLFVVSVIGVCVSNDTVGNAVLAPIVENIIPHSTVNAGTPTPTEIGHNYTYNGINTVDIKRINGIPITAMHDPSDYPNCNLQNGMPAAPMFHKATFSYEYGSNTEGVDWCNDSGPRPWNYLVERGNAVGYTTVDNEGSIALYEDPTDSARFCLKMETDSTACGGSDGTDCKLWNEADEDGGWAQDYTLTEAFGYSKLYIPSGEGDTPEAANLWQWMNDPTDRCTEHTDAPQSKIVFRSTEYGGSTANKLLWNNEAGDNTFDEIISMVGMFDKWFGISTFISESSDCGEADGGTIVWIDGAEEYADDTVTQRSCRGEGYCGVGDGATWWFLNSINSYGSTNDDGNYVLWEDHMYSSAYLGPTRY